jgi:hypothetical protein
MWSRLEFACKHVALAVILQPCSGSSGSLPEAIWSWLAGAMWSQFQLTWSHVQPSELSYSHVEPAGACL